MSNDQETEHNAASADATLDDRARAIAGMLVGIRMASGEIRKACHDSWLLYYNRNKLRLQAIGIQLSDVSRELTIELRKVEASISKEQDGHGAHDLQGSAQG